jgi:transposase
MENITTLGIDLAKNVFQLHGIDKNGKVVLRKKLSRGQLTLFVANLSPCVIGMESCGGSQYWGRVFEKFGHEVKLIPAQYVKPFVKSNKNDARDAEAICEAVLRPNMHFVPGKSVQQHDMQNLHRVRQGFIAERTALGNRIRGMLLEYGIIVAKNLAHLRQGLPRILEDAENELSEISRGMFLELYEELRRLDERVLSYDKQIRALFLQNERAQRISKIPGVGPMTATAVVAAVGENARVFKNGRQMAAWLGLVPRQHSSGGKNVLLGISKRGDSYLRTLLVHGARSVLFRVDKKLDKKSEWLKGVKQRRGNNKAAVALANKNARVICAMLKSGESYDLKAA